VSSPESLLAHVAVLATEEHTMKMLDAKLILVFKLLKLLLRSLLVMLLVFGSRLDTTLHVLADEQDLAVLIVQVFWLDFDPS
jgi:hypothetical protein